MPSRAIFASRLSASFGQSGGRIVAESLAIGRSLFLARDRGRTRERDGGRGDRVRPRHTRELHRASAQGPRDRQRRVAAWCAVLRGDGVGARGLPRRRQDVQGGEAHGRVPASVGSLRAHRAGDEPETLREDGTSAFDTASPSRHDVVTTRDPPRDARASSQFKLYRSPTDVAHASHRF